MGILVIWIEVLHITVLHSVEQRLPMRQHVAGNADLLQTIHVISAASAERRTPLRSAGGCDGWRHRIGSSHRYCAAWKRWLC
jgi:hypothetical protein